MHDFTQSKKSIFEDIFAGWRRFGDLKWLVVNLAVVACVFRATTKKGRQVFRRKKCTSEKIMATSILQ